MAACKGLRQCSEPRVLYGLHKARTVSGLGTQSLLVLHHHPMRLVGIAFQGQSRYNATPPAQ